MTYKYNIIVGVSNNQSWTKFNSVQIACDYDPYGMCPHRLATKHHRRSRMGCQHNMLRQPVGWIRNEASWWIDSAFDLIFFSMYYFLFDRFRICESRNKMNFWIRYLIMYAIGWNVKNFYFCIDLCYVVLSSKSIFHTDGPCTLSHVERYSYYDSWFDVSLGHIILVASGDLLSW